MGINAVVFPGQGSQYPLMGKDLYDNFKEAKDIFLQVDNYLGFKISDICFSSDKEILKKTFYQQLAILSVSLAAYEVFSKKNVKISFLSGLSLGEYSCLYPAKVLGLKDLVYLVKERASLMEEASRLNSSCMFAVIGSDLNALKELSNKHNFYISNINSNSQVVISLKLDDKDRIKSLFSSLGIRFIELEVSGGFHSKFMLPAKENLKKVIDKLEFNDAKIPIVSNFTARAHTNSLEIKNNLIEQLTSTVLWKDCVEFMIRSSVDTFIELGPSKILSGLIKKINNSVRVFNIEKKEDLGYEI